MENDSDKLDGTINLLVQMRDNAKQNKDYALSDKIRDNLSRLGIQLKDTKEGTNIHNKIKDMIKLGITSILVAASMFTLAQEDTFSNKEGVNINSP